MTLFLSVIIQNYAKSTGTSCYTDKQRMWYELEKSLKLSVHRFDLTYSRVHTEKSFSNNSLLFGQISIWLCLVCCWVSSLFLSQNTIHTIHQYIGFEWLFCWYWLYFILSLFFWKFTLLGGKDILEENGTLMLFITVISFAFKIADFFVESYTFWLPKSFLCWYDCSYHSIL